MKEILQKIKDLKAVANMTVNYDSAMASNQITAIRRAETELVEVMKQYTDALSRDTVAIVVTGEGTDQFVNEAEANGISAVQNLEAPLKDLLSGFSSNLYLNQPLTIDMVIMVESLVKSAFETLDIKVNSIDLELIPQNVTFQSEEQFLEVMVDLFLGATPSLNADTVMRVIATEAADQEVGKKAGIYPIILTANNLNTIMNLKRNNKFRKIVTVAAGNSPAETDMSVDKVTSKSVEELLKTIKKSLKN